MSKHKLSVVLPTIYSTEYLREAIGSIVEQKFEDFEVIVVASENQSHVEEIVEDINDDRVTVYFVSNDATFADALNHGANESTGEYIVRHEPDDISSPDRFGKQVLYLESNPDVVVVGCDTYVLSSGGARIEKTTVSEAVSLNDCLNQNQFVHGTLMYRAETFDEIGGYDTFFKEAPGYDLILRLLNVGKGVNLTEPLYHVRTYRTMLPSQLIRESALYHYFAAAEISPDDETQTQLATVREHGITSYYSMMEEDERMNYHLDVVDTFIRYRRFMDAIKEYRKSLKYGIGIRHIWSASDLVTAGLNISSGRLPRGNQQRFRELDHRTWTR